MNKNILNSKFNLGIALLLLGSLLVLNRSESRSNIENYSFASEPVKVLGLSSDQVDENYLPKRIIIPDLSIDLNVKRAEIIEGYWEVFPDSAAWGAGSGVPGEVGNQVIFAHDKKGLFLPLKSVKKGTRAYVLTDTGWYVYEIYEIKEVFPRQTEVIAKTDDETLTLYTCSGIKDSKRLIVIGKRVND